MIKKILWATDGSEDSVEALKCAELLAINSKADILGLSVLPGDYQFFDTFSPEERKKLENSFKATIELKERKNLEEIKKKLTQHKLHFSYKITKGIASKEIITVAESEKVDLITLGRGRSVDKFTMGGTVLKVLRNCKMPILTARKNDMKTAIKKILVPVVLSHGLTANFDYALKLSEIFNAELQVANIVETGGHEFPDSLMEKIKSNTKMELRHLLREANATSNIRIYVEAGRNAWVGITELARANDIDLIVIMTYGGTVFREEFLGSIALNVIQESSVPVITLTPHKATLKMIGDENEH
ncbi:MAG: universal stress protein [Thermodesulfobacteriota bacterium]